jgi:hypothetical protein
LAGFGKEGVVRVWFQKTAERLPKRGAHLEKSLEAVLKVSQVEGRQNTVFYA